MNSIPIVTLDNLAKNSFEVNAKKLDVKISKESGNGLVFKNDGLFFKPVTSVGGFERIILGQINDTALTYTYNALNLMLMVADLGSDGTYLRLLAKQAFDHIPIDNAYMRRSEHQDTHHNSGTSAYTFADNADEGGWTSRMFHRGGAGKIDIVYTANDVIHVLQVNAVYLNGQYFAWMDVINSTQVVSTVPPIGDGEIVING